MKERKTDTDETDFSNLKRDFAALGDAFDTVYGRQATAFQEIITSGKLDDDPEMLEAVTSAMSFADGEINEKDAKLLRDVAREHDITTSVSFSLVFRPGSTEADVRALAGHLTDLHPNLQIEVSDSGYGFELQGLPQDILSVIDYIRYAIMQRDDIQAALKTASDKGDLTEKQYDAFMEECEQATRELQFLFD